MYAHEVLDDSVERGAFVTESELLALGGLTGAQSPEVLHSLWNGPTVSSETRERVLPSSLSIETHDDTTEGFSSVLNVEEDLVISYNLDRPITRRRGAAW